MAELPDLTAAQTAARLGIKPETLYAYVSRGRLTRRRGPGGSRFDPLEVEAFARGRRSGPRPSTRTAGHSPGSPLMTIDTDITLIEDDHLYFRGRDAGELVGTGGFETICHWLWTYEWTADVRFAPSIPGRDAVAALAPALPSAMSLRDRLQVGVTALAAVDPLRHDLARPSVVRIAAEIVGGAVEALPVRGGQPGSDARLAARLWTRLTTAAPDPALVDLLDAALVLVVDHDLAVSTLAVRAAASARAHPYAVVACGLAALDSALHGNAGRAAYEMVQRRLAGEPADRVVAAAVAGHGVVPGFGHRIYRRADPRWSILAGLIAGLDPAAPALAAAQDLAAVITERMATFPNVDLALAVLALSLDLEPGATEVVFALGRCGGWIAHALAEYEQPPLRLRPEGRYTGP